jgi:hypothetical protein
MTETDYVLSISPTLIEHVGTHTVTVGKAILLNPAEGNRSYSSTLGSAAPGEDYASS